ncbi:hypothetical protein pdam_00023688, partial [Pocillopora damicornis]
HFGREVRHVTSIFGYNTDGHHKTIKETSKLTWSIRRTKTFSMSAPIILNIKLLQDAESIVDKSKINPTPTPLYLSLLSQGMNSMEL